MKKVIGIVIALLLVFAPLTTRAHLLVELPESTYEALGYDESEYDYEDESDEWIEPLAGTLTIGATEETTTEETNETVQECDHNKLFSKTNLIFLAVGLVIGFLLNLVTVLITRSRCGCECNKEKKEKKNGK